jgi:hypothetical protein
LRAKTGSLWVIDGQHRLYSFANVEDRSSRLLTVIVDSKKLKKEKVIPFQADLFYKLNHHAKRIQPALIFELFKELIDPETALQRIAIKIWESPVFKPIVKAYSGSSGFVDIVTLATTSSMKSLARRDGLILRNAAKYTVGKDINERGIAEISNFVIAYLKVIRSVFRTEWAKDQYIVCDNRGFRAFMRVLVYFLNKNKGASKTKIMNIARKALKKLKSSGEFDFEATENTGKWIGESGATSLAEKWIDIFSGIPTAKHGIPPKEDENTEFKETYRYDIKNGGKINKELQIVVSKEVSAFLNTTGGTVYIGITDKGELVGIDRDIELLGGADNHQNRLETMISQSLDDHLDAEDIDIKIRFEKLKGKEYVMISVREHDKPVYFKKDQFYIRRNARMKELKGRKMVEYVQAKFGTD